MMNDNTLQDLLDISREQDEAKDDFKTKVSEFRFIEESGQIEIPTMFGPRVNLRLNDRALMQATKKVGPPRPPFTYLRDCPPHLKGYNLEQTRRELLKGKPDQEWFVRAYQGESRAILSGMYTPISNTEILETTIELIGDTPHKLIRPRIHPDYLFLKVQVADKDTADGNYGIGAFIGNGEVGNYKLQVSSFVQRGPCANTIRYNKGGWEHKHIHISREMVFAFLKAHIAEAFKLGPTLIDAVVRAQANKMPDLADVVTGLVKKHGLSQDARDNILLGTEGAYTSMGLVNGLSFAAHRTAKMDDDSRHKLEGMAGDKLATFFFQENEYAEVAPIVAGSLQDGFTREPRGEYVHPSNR